jgi:hypothetical protein
MVDYILRPTVEFENGLSRVVPADEASGWTLYRVDERGLLSPLAHFEKDDKKNAERALLWMVKRAAIGDVYRLSQADRKNLIS